MLGDYTICMVMSGSGVQIGMLNILQKSKMKIQILPHTVANL